MNKKKDKKDKIKKLILFNPKKIQKKCQIKVNLKSYNL